MTSITNMMNSFQMPPTPRARIDAKISAAASAGTISQTDETALETAVDAIGQSLRSGATVASTSTANTAGTSFKDKLDGLIDAQVTGGTLTDAQATELKGMFGQGAPSQGVQGQDASGDTDDSQVAATGGTTAAASGAVHGHHHHGGGSGGAMAAIMAALDGSDSTDGSTDTSAIDALTGTTATGTTGSTTSSTTASAATAITATGSTTAAATPVGSTDLATQQLDKMISFLEKVRESIGSAQTYGNASASNSGTDAAGMVFSGLA